MWIRFWHRVRCSSGITTPESWYAWYDSRPSDEALMDEARECVPSWAMDSERGCDFGFEDADNVPDDEKRRMINTYVKMREHADKMLAILKDER